MLQGLFSVFSHLSLFSVMVESPAMIKTLLLFDIDGTLLLSGDCGKAALEQAFEEMFGIPNCWGDTAAHGKTDPAINDAICRRLIGRGLSPTEKERLASLYHRHFRHKIDHTDQYRLMPGVPELLDFLSKRKDIFLSLGTGNLEPAAWMKLEHGNIRHYFKCGGFGSDADNRPDILRHAIRRSEEIIGRSIPQERTFVIGDTVHDIAAANAAGLRSIAVLTNGFKESDFDETSPDFILPDLSDIPGFISCLE
jgi:phosphoglycolate phosphatase-like HAD superfamily hydrolase